MPNKQQIAEQALAQSGLKVEKLSSEQRKKIVNKIVKRLPPGRRLETRAVASFGCTACEIGLNVLVGAPIAVIVAAGVLAVGPEAAVAVTVAEFFGADAATVATAINGALAGGGGASVEGVIFALCQAFGACE